MKLIDPQYPRSYIVAKKTWYYLPRTMSNTPVLEEIDNITLGCYLAGCYGGVGEFNIRWYKFISDGRIVVRIEAFDDSWNVLSNFKDVLDLMANYDTNYPYVDKPSITPEQVIEICQQCGIVDRTEYKHPLK